MGTAPAGEFTVSAPKPDLAYRFTPYRPGEKLRPEAKITASVTEGLPPLTVQFAQRRQRPVALGFRRRRDQRRAQPHARLPEARTLLRDAYRDGRRWRQRPVLRANRRGPGHRRPDRARRFPQGETPALKLHGTARRTADGGLHLPDGAPWGWVQVGDATLEDLRGLRSFTILGWLKPESLQVGSGGNRIVFCLNKDHSGIDLVCHADGRLRLAVNQWPDSDLQNDSSPGKLQVGKWTFFAVTYDATQPRDNVSWYFSPPVDAPGQAAVALDRKTSYDAGPVAADIGPLWPSATSTTRCAATDWTASSAARFAVCRSSAAAWAGAEP